LAFIGRSIDRSLSIYLNALKSAIEPSERHGYIPLSEATQYCSYGIEYLSYLARTGRLGAVKIGPKWMTTREVDRLSWDNYNEVEDLKRVVQEYFERYGYIPKSCAPTRFIGAGTI
jgi:hypothetical protein